MSLLLAAVMLLADEEMPPPKVADFLRICEINGNARISELKQQIKLADSTKIKATPAERRAMKAEAVEAIKLIQDGRVLFMPRLDASSLRVGQAGLIISGGRDAPASFKVSQIIDEKNAILSREDEAFWVVMPTTGLVDDNTVKLTGPMEVAGTKKYTTVTGAGRTVLLLQRFDTTEIERWHGILQARKAAADPKK